MANRLSRWSRTSLTTILLTPLPSPSLVTIRFCFDDRCLRFYHDGTGQAAWPRQRFTRGVDRDDPSVWEWRSHRMKLFLRKVADAAHSVSKWWADSARTRSCKSFSPPVSIILLGTGTKLQASAVPDE